MWIVKGKEEGCFGPILTPEGIARFEHHECLRNTWAGDRHAWMAARLAELFPLSPI